MIRRSHSRLLVAMAAVLAAAACDEESITLDSGDPSTLDVLVYVDADGNGAFEAGVDEPIASATVAASGPVEVSGTTGPDGVATLEGLIPGSYTLSLTADAPAGAVLATASSPVVVADFRGGALEAEFRFAFEPGSITGRLFRDDDDDSTFDPETDLPAAGIGVTAERSRDGAVFETTTEDDGSFELTGLRPGTYTVTFDLPEDAELENGGPFTVEVGPSGSAAVQAIFTGELVVDIADARDAPAGQTVTVEGTVTWAPSFDDAQLFIQDATGGISVFDFGLGDLAPAGGLSVGDRVRLTGSRGAFDGEVQIGDLAAFEVLGSAAPPVPVQATAAEIDAGELPGQLVSVDGTVEQVDVLDFGNQMVLLRDANGETFAVKVDSRTGVEADTWEVGSLYGVTGVVGTDVDEGGTDIEDDHPNRVEVRSPDDVQPGGATTDIADARGNLGATVVVEGIVTWAPDFADAVLFLQDGTGGISVFDFDLTDFAPAGGFMRGDLIRIAGTVGAFGGEVQIEDVSAVTVLADVAEPDPEGTTGAEINAGDDQGELVVATGTVSDVEVLSFDNQLVTLTDAAGTGFSVYVDSRTGVMPSAWTVGERYRVTGVIGADDANTPAARIEVRGPGDVTSIGAGDAISIAEARAMPGATVTISGTVTRTAGWDDRVAFVQDGTAGIAIFASDGAGVAEGDRVTLTGEIGAFNGEVQIDPSDVTVDASGDVPDPLMVTGSQINGGLFQGRLVEVTGEVVDVEVINSFGTQEVTLLTPDGASVTVLVDNRTGLTEADWTEGQTVTVVGVLGWFEDNDPPAQLELYHDTDVTFGS